jgi:NAD(P)-dependent dehydrogenase (short-subunit alcohol dehydrogenase family)
MARKLDDLFNLRDKVIVITGANGLLGRQHAEAVAAYGGNPILLDLNQNDVESLAEELNAKYSVNASGYLVDITDENQIKLNVLDLIKSYGKIDCLVNNAANNPKVEEDSVEVFSRLENFPLDHWSKDLEVGLTGSFLCAKHYGYEISKNNNGGSIVNISSDLGLIAPDQRLYVDPNTPENMQKVKPITYSIVKTGLIGLTRYLATYWARKNVRCNALCPGGIENGQNISFLNEVSYRIPMNRLANVNEYQGSLIWLLSDASSYLNGAIIPIDGGRTCW